MAHRNFRIRCRHGLILLLLAMAVVMSGASDGRSEAATTAAAPIKAPITSASEISYPPFSSVDANGRATGFSVELMTAALAAMGRDVTYRTGPWTEVKGLLEKGEIQALPLVGRTPERESVFDFTFPYMSIHGAIVVRKGTTDINNLSDLRGRQVAVMRGDNAEEFLLREDRGINIYRASTFEEALCELSEGRHDAVVIQRLVALRLIQEADFTNLVILNQPIEGFRQDFCFAVREGDKDTLALLNEGLALVMADGTYNHLHAKWFAALELPTNRRIVIGGDANYPPFEYLDENGRPAGYNVDLTRAIALETGLDIEIRLGPWNEIRDALANGEIDALQGMFYSIERDLTLDFTVPHAVNHGIGVVRKGEDPPATVADLAGKRIVVRRGGLMHDFALANQLGTQVSVVPSQEDALREVAEGNYDCALVSRLSALYFIEKNNWDTLSAGKQPLYSPDYCYAVLDNHKALLAQLGEGLKLVEENWEYRRIYQKWMGVYEDSQLSLMTVLRYILWAAVPLVVIFSGVILWLWSLRKQVAQKTKELRLQKAMLDETGQIAQVGGWRFDAVTGEGFWTDEVARIHDLDPAHPISKDIGIQYYADGSREKIAAAVKAAVEQGVSYDLELEIISAKGVHKWIRTIGHPVVKNSRVVRVQGSLQDITERVHLEARKQDLEVQLHQAQKMESIGRLAGGVAHDYNNMLSVIVGFADLAIEKVLPEDPVLADLMEIVTAAKRSINITRQLLAFARRQAIAPVVLDLNETIEQMLKMLRRLIGEDIDLVWHPRTEIGRVKMDPTQLDQILANLCVNARDAIADVGKVTIETATAIFDDAYCADHTGFSPGEFVMLAVSDDGHGMDNDTLARLFEPFFSTKELGRGTGLGLATVYGIVKQNDGFINVYSEPGKGTTFKIYLPRHSGEEMAVPQEIIEETPKGNGEAVLVVEDEPATLKLIDRMLDSLGYKAIAASSPPEAVRLAGSHKEKISLLITDVIMPEMNGRQLARELQTISPGLKCLFMSGYTADVIAHRGVLEEGVNFIQKPFSKKDLAVKIKAAL